MAMLGKVLCKVLQLGFEGSVGVRQTKTMRRAFARRGQCEWIHGKEKYHSIMGHLILMRSLIYQSRGYKTVSSRTR